MPSSIDRDAYFDKVRDALFGGSMTQQQVDGQNVILSVWEYGAGGTPMTDIRWLVTEYGSEDYLQGKPYYPYVGRGYVQLTWEENYRNAGISLGLIDDRDLVAHPAVALDSLIAARVMFRGMAEGWFTGKKLGQYFNDEDDDPVNARRIINGNDCDQLIADYHYVFLNALDDDDGEFLTTLMGGQLRLF
jgi:putative chitinase